jgi:nucleotide-binding universal stress UspA family protein
MRRESKYYSNIFLIVYKKCVYKSLLVPVEDSEQSLSAVRLAGVLSYGCGASITLFHVRIPPQTVVTDIVTPDKLFAIPLMQQERALFMRCKEILREFDVEPEVKLVESGMVASSIIKECESGSYDVIVMGHRGRRSVKQLLLGSVANGVLVEARCPVIMMHMPARGE